MNLEGLEFTDQFITLTMQRSAVELAAFAKGVSSLTKRDMINNVINSYKLVYIVRSALDKAIDPAAAPGRAQIESPRFRPWFAECSDSFYRPMVLHTIFSPLRALLKENGLDHTVLPDLDPTKATIEEARLDKKPAKAT